MKQDEIINHVKEGESNRLLAKIVEEAGGEKPDRNMVWITGSAISDRPDLDEMRINFLFENQGENMIVKDSWTFDTCPLRRFKKPILLQAEEFSLLFTAIVRKNYPQLFV